MKSKNVVPQTMTVLLISIAFMIYPSKAFCQTKTNQMPNDVATILKNSCSACHGDNGSGMPKMMLNVDAWDKYNTDKQAKKADAVCNAITKGSMPPAKYKEANADKVPTNAQKDVVCKWANSFKQQ